MAIKPGPDGVPPARLTPPDRLDYGRSEVGGGPAPDGVSGSAAESHWQPAAPAQAAASDAAVATGGVRRSGATPAQRSGQGATTAATPEHPTRADNVKLSGEMEESAFEDQQWLVQRDGRFIQLTELLYLILEQATGQQSPDQIAERVSERYDKRVSGDNVRQLLQTKLIPMGLVAQADGSVVSTASSDAMRSPLAVNLRMAMVSPSLIEPITAVLQFLYWPPVLVVTLLAAGAAQFWLYFIHGIGTSVHDVIYRPGLLLLVLAAVVLSAGFHEFGHAAALRYGGGKVRGMGAGIYLVYPAFYTDVTDAYRLGRWGRVRTDLGGIYFNFIFALGVIGLYLVTQWEFLLITVVLLNFETLHQLLPFIRLDGYWAIADLTGIPDFFSQMGAYLRSILPFGSWEGRKLPQLKWWAKVVFGLYIVTALPLLVGMLFLMVKGLPRLAATAWDSFRQQLGALSTASGGGDILGMLGAVAQMLLLALPMLGAAYLLYTLGRRAVTGLWSWSEGSAPRRLVASVGTVAAMGLVAYLWMPQLSLDWRSPTGGASAPTARTAFVPLQSNERGTVQDLLAGVVSIREPGEIGYRPDAMNANPVAAGTPTPVDAVVTPGATAATPASGTPVPGLPAGAVSTPAPDGSSVGTPSPAGTPAGSKSPPTPSKSGGATPAPAGAATPAGATTPSGGSGATPRAGTPAPLTPTPANPVDTPTPSAATSATPESGAAGPAGWPTNTPAPTTPSAPAATSVSAPAAAGTAAAGTPAGGAAAPTAAASTSGATGGTAGGPAATATPAPR